MDYYRILKHCRDAICNTRMLYKMKGSGEHICIFCKIIMTPLLKGDKVMLYRSDSEKGPMCTLNFPSHVTHSPGCGPEVCTNMRRLTTGIRSEKCVVRRLRRCANVYLHKPG